MGWDYAFRLTSNPPALLPGALSLTAELCCSCVFMVLVSAPLFLNRSLRPIQIYPYLTKHQHGTSWKSTPAEQCCWRFASRDFVVNGRVAPNEGIAGPRGAGMPLRGPDRLCATCAAFRSVLTFAHCDHTCFVRFLAGTQKVTWPPLRTGTTAGSPRGKAKRSDNPKPLRATARAAPM